MWMTVLFIVYTYIWHNREYVGVCGIGSMKAKAHIYIILAGSSGPVVYGLVSWHLIWAFSGGFFFNVCISQLFIHYLEDCTCLCIHPGACMYVLLQMVQICWLLDVCWTVSTNFLVPWDCCRILYEDDGEHVGWK